MARAWDLRHPRVGRDDLLPGPLEPIARQLVNMSKQFSDLRPFLNGTRSPPRVPKAMSTDVACDAGCPLVDVPAVALREPPWPEPARGEDSGRCRHPAREVGRAIHYRLKPAVQRDAGRTGLRAVHVRGGNLVGLATATSTHILHLEKASLCAAPAWLCSQRMRDELGQRAAACPGFEGTRFLFQYPVDYFDLPHDL